MNSEKLSEILTNHKAWLKNEEGGERADLRHANLRHADLRSADLRHADLRHADLRYANLRDANLGGASGNMVEIKSIQADIWPITYTSEVMQIGCQRHAITDWWDFSDEEISTMDSRALAWWRVWKPILQAIIEASPAVPTGYQEK